MTLPLAGIKVVDFSEHGFVPSGAAALGDWGADVVKIERIDGDPMRAVIRNGLSPDADGCDYLFELTNRNKRGIALDVTTPAGRVRDLPAEHRRELRPVRPAISFGEVAIDELGHSERAARWFPVARLVEHAQHEPA